MCPSFCVSRCNSVTQGTHVICFWAWEFCALSQARLAGACRALRPRVAYLGLHGAGARQSCPGGARRRLSKMHVSLNIDPLAVRDGYAVVYFLPSEVNTKCPLCSMCHMCLCSCDLCACHVFACSDHVLRTLSFEHPPCLRAACT